VSTNPSRFLAGGTNWFNAVTGYGADPTGARDSSAAIQSAITAAIAAHGGVVYLPAGTYKVAATITADFNNTAAVYIVGDGRWATFLNSAATGDCLRIKDGSSTAPGGRAYNGGGISGLTIDGTSAGNASTGLHMGDIFQFEADIAVQNFSGTGSIGVHFDNATFWTEQLKAQIYAQNCTTHVVFDVSGAVTSTASFGRSVLDIDIAQGAATQDGVVFQNGAVLYDGELALRGNFLSSASALTSCALRITGTVPAGHPFAGGPSLISDCLINFGLECASGANTPITIIRGATSNKITQCYGVMDFGGTSSPANFTAAAAIGIVWPFNGSIFGDLTLGNGGSGFPTNVTWSAVGGFALGQFVTAQTLINGASVATSISGASVALCRVTAAGNVTGIILGLGSFDGQTLWVINESNFAITMAASGTSKVADGVSDVIPALCARMYVFDGNDTALWYRCA
jgi:hypothetical protein